jgi:TPR repeat protein
MFNLAMSYFEPREGEPDYAQALPWLRKAAELEHADAMMALAVACFTGKGVEKDIKAAADWIQRAAEFGQPQALALVEQSKKAAEERKPLPEPKLAPDSKPAAAPISIMPPADWRKVENAIAVAAFEIGEGDAKATLAVIPLPGEAGGLTANVNRWRSQLALPAADEAAIQKAARSIKVGGVEGRLIDLVGEGADARRILGVIAVRGEQTWFIKLMGPAASVAAQQAAFEAFVTSIKFRE